MTAGAMIEVITAYDDGKEIEVRPRHGGDDWRGWHVVDPLCPRFNFCDYEYRIKPEPPKPREFWIRLCGDLIPETNSLFGSECGARKHYRNCDHVIHVREVLD